MSIRKTIFAVAFLAAASSAGEAHHGVTGLYDTSTPIILEGRVTEATFSPPHPVVTVAVEQPASENFDVDRPDEFTGAFVVRAEDIGAVREVEFSPVNTFYALRGAVNVGDRVTILALRNCRSPYQLRSSWIRLGDGTVVSYEGGLHRRSDGCP